MAFCCRDYSSAILPSQAVRCSRSAGLAGTCPSSSTCPVMRRSGSGSFQASSSACSQAPVVLTWFYNKSAGRAVSAMLWHASFNFVTGAPAAAGFTAAVISLLVVVWAVAVVVGGSPRGRGRPEGRPRLLNT